MKQIVSHSNLSLYVHIYIYYIDCIFSELRPSAQKNEKTNANNIDK